MRPIYLTELNRPSGNLLAVIAYGRKEDAPIPDKCPHIRVDMEPLGGAALYEIWQGQSPVRYRREQDITLAEMDGVLFGALSMDPGVGCFAAVTQAAYSRIFAITEQAGFPHLVRCWNYFPAITEQDGALERYHAFSLGRHEAFARASRRIESAPAACALGSAAGPFNILFLAARVPGQPIENPRQISAYKYPEQYGPKSPVFSRAMLSSMGGNRGLFISGTASIVGHASLHENDVAAQLEETLANIDALLREARRAGLSENAALQLKAYIRDPAMAPAVQQRVAHWLPPSGQLVCLKADICRKELLVEIEGFCA